MKDAVHRRRCVLRAKTIEVYKYNPKMRPRWVAP
jgi:hypothetical protein